MTLAIADLSFREANPNSTIKGSAIQTGPTPSLDTALAVGADTRVAFGSLVTGNLLDGFSVNLFGNSGASGAAAASVSIAGRATATIGVLA